MYNLATNLTTATAVTLLLCGCAGGGLGVRSAGNSSASYKAGGNITNNYYGNQQTATLEAAKTVDAAKVAANAAVTGTGTSASNGNPGVGGIQGKTSTDASGHQNQQVQPPAAAPTSDPAPAPVEPPAEEPAS